MEFKLNKRIFSLLLALCILFSIFCVSCGDENTLEIPTDDDKIPSEDSNAGDTDSDQTTSESPVETWGADIIAVQNQLAKAPILTRSFYPDYNNFLTKLFTLNAALGTDVTDLSMVGKECLSLLQTATGMNLLYDFYENPSISDTETTYGVVTDDKPLGGGFGYDSGIPIKKITYVVHNDNDFYDAMKAAKKGDVIYIAGETVIDLSDWILAGELVDFMNSSNVERVPLEFKIPAGVTLMGDRGYSGSKGAVLKSTSYVNMLLSLDADARLTGLTLQGCDTPDNATNIAANHSIGIVVKGDGARIDNCEISGFYRYGITVENASNVEIDHNYIHHISGNDAGIAIRVDKSVVNIHHNTFAHATRLLSMGGKETVVSFKNNIDGGNITKEYFQLLANAFSEFDAEFDTFRSGVHTFELENNTLLSAVDPFLLKGLPLQLTVKNNYFGYPDACYEILYEEKTHLLAAIYETRIKFERNAYDVNAPVVVSKSGSAPEKSDNPKLSSFSVAESSVLSAQVFQKIDAPKISYQKTVRPDIISGSFQSDFNDSPYEALLQFADKGFSAADKNITDSTEKSIGDVINQIGSYTNFYTYKDDLSAVVDGENYGIVDDGQPLGGGVGYNNILHFDKAEKGVYFATDLSSLSAAMIQAKAGEIIYIPSGTVIDLSNALDATVTTLKPKEGVTIASDRGYVNADGSVSVGGMIKSTLVYKDPIIRIEAENIRITGLVIEGPDPARHLALWDRCFDGKTNGSAGTQLGHTYLSFATPSTGIEINANRFEIDNCEVSGFSSSAIMFTALSQSADAVTDNKVHHNYIHHNQMKALGYGVNFGIGNAQISYCLFNYNRHSLAGTGKPKCGYTAFCNVEMGETISDHFDMHGGSDRKDGTDIAGEYIDVYNNVYLSSMRPYNNRGVPAVGRTFHHNIHLASRESFGNVLLINRYTNQPIACLEIGKNLWNLTDLKVG